MRDFRDIYEKKDAPPPGPETKKQWRGPCLPTDATSSNKMDGQPVNATDASKQGKDTPKESAVASSGQDGRWKKKLLAGAMATLLSTTAFAQDVTTTPSTRDGHGNELCPRNVSHYPLESRGVTGSFNNLPYRSWGHPDLPRSRVGGVEVPWPTSDNIMTVLRNEEFQKEFLEMCRKPEEFYRFLSGLSELAKSQTFIESIRPACMDQDVKTYVSDLCSKPEFQELCKDPEYKKCFEDLACKVGFEGVDKTSPWDEPMASGRRGRRRRRRRALRRLLRTALFVYVAMRLLD